MLLLVQVKIDRGVIKVSKVAGRCLTTSDHVITSAVVFRQQFAPLLLSLWSFAIISPGMLLKVPAREIWEQSNHARNMGATRGM